jgi:hypothetical protein
MIFVTCGVYAITIDKSKVLYMSLYQFLGANINSGGTYQSIAISVGAFRRLPSQRLSPIMSKIGGANVIGKKVPI